MGEKTYDYVCYTDGACDDNTAGKANRGGYGIVILLRDGFRDEFYEGYTHTTNNRMELMGVIKALENTDEGSSVLIISDSKYVVDGCSKWMRNWKARGWIIGKTLRQAQPLKNLDLWWTIDELMAKRSVEFQWIKGHSGNEWNELADKLAEKATREAEFRDMDGDLTVESVGMAQLEKLRGVSMFV